MCMNEYYMCGGAQGGKMSDALELKSQILMSHIMMMWVVGSKLRSLRRANVLKH